MDQPARPIGQRQGRLLAAIFGTVIALAAVLAAGLFYQGQGPIIAEIPFFVPTISGIVGLAAWGVAYLVMGRYRVLRDPPAFWIALCFSALGVLYLFYLLTWPGAREGGGGIIARLPSTSAWMALLQNGVLAVLLPVAAMAPWPAAGSRGARHWLAWIGAWVFLWLALSALIVVGEARLDTINLQRTAGRQLLLVGLLALDTLGAFVAARRYLRTGSRLLAYIALASLWSLGSGIASLMFAARYDLWWYLFRLLAMAPVLVMLYGVLAEYVGLFKRERERSDELRRQKALLETVLAQMPAGVRIAEAPSGLLLTNNPPQGAGLSSLTPPSTLLRDEDTAWRGYHPDGRPYLTGEWPLQRALRHGETIHDEEVHLKRDGGARRVLAVSAAPVRDSLGRIIAAVAIHLDQTQRQQDERALRESEARLRDVLLNSRDVLYRLNLATQAYEYVSPAIEALTGYSVEEVQRMGPGAVAGLVHPEDQPLYKAYAGALLQAPDETPGSTLEFRWRTKSGAYRWFSMSGRFVRDAAGHPIAHVGSLRDITEQQEAELARRRLAEQRQLALDAARMGWWFYDPRTETATYDERFAEIMGLPGNQCPLQEVEQRMHPEDASRADAIMKTALDLAPRHYVFTCRVIQDDGSLRWIEAYGSLILEGQAAARQVAGLVGTIADITERKRAEEALQAANDELTRFNRAMVGRELRMLALKQEVNELCLRLGQPPRYRLDEERS